LELVPLKRDVNKVPFVELYDRRLQGVVSSGSDIKRVYVSYFEAKTLEYFCSTNNNRPCGGLRGSPCKHLDSLLKEAIKHYGLEQVVRFMIIEDEIGSERDILAKAKGLVKNPAGEVFSRFLAYLQLLEHPVQVDALLEMDWFLA
jgi:hypothetical protein